MMSSPFTRSLQYICCLSAALATITTPARADVTVQQKTSLDVASVVHLHGAITTNISADKKREDAESHCEGMMSLLCGNVQSGEIVRLDRDLSWQLEPKKKHYRELVFATPEEIAAMRAKMQANLEKMRSCPVSQPQQQPIDKSKCQMSPPKIEVHKTDARLSIAGHETQKTSATLTESCTDRETGDVCDTVVAFDVWLTPDSLPGSADRRAFEMAYAKKLGLADSEGVMRGEVAKFLAPYQSQIKQLTDKAGDFKGQPLKTSVRVLMGGRQCGATAKLKSNGETSGAADSTPGAANSASTGNPLNDMAQAGKNIGSSVGHLMGGLFHKKSADSPEDTSAAAASSAAAGANSLPPAEAPPDPYAQYSQLAAFSVETVSIDAGAVPAARFDVPPDWTKETLKPSKGADEDYTCPKS